MRDFHSLEIWKKGHQLTLDVYRITENFPKSEIYALTSQIRRASYSIPMNIAEGCGRKSESEFRQFLQIAVGSSMEVEYQLLLSHDLGYIDKSCYTDLTSKVISLRKMVLTFIAHTPHPKAPKVRPQT